MESSQRSSTWTMIWPKAIVTPQACDAYLLMGTSLMPGGLSLQAQNEIFDDSMTERYQRLVQLLQNLGLMKGAEAEQPGQKAWQPQHGLFKHTFEIATHGRVEVRMVSVMLLVVKCNGLAY